MKYTNMNEEELKNKVARDFFHAYDCTEILKRVDFAVRAKQNNPLFNIYFLWAEAKRGKNNVLDMLAQLVLTIGKAKMYTETHLPAYLGCFDANEIAFIPFSDIQDVFYLNDFNWNVTSSDRSTKEFANVRKRIENITQHNTYIFNFERDETELKSFIKDNFWVGSENTTKVRISKSNFYPTYRKWVVDVKPAIDFRWEEAQKVGILDADFYLADLISSENMTLKDKLFILLRNTHYEMDRHKGSLGSVISEEVSFIQGGKAMHERFWSIYERPPSEEYWDYMISRRDLLVPQDVRERKGAFFTPSKWVDLSQQYIADVFGDDWQDEYYVWDCATGTGNLLAGLLNKYNIWASTLERGDVGILHDRIKNGANLLPDHCFQFDFLNDDFSKLPLGLQKIINETPEKLIIYINPPYAECGNLGGREQKGGVSNTNETHKLYSSVLGRASRDLFALFLIKIYKKIPHCKICNFAKLKVLCAPNFESFREVFQAKLERLFVVPADTFDNVKGQFPIGFHIWDTAKIEVFKQITAEAYDKNGVFLCQKTFYNFNKNTNSLKHNGSYNGYRKKDYINDWIIFYTNHKNNKEINIGNLSYNCNDFQHQPRTAVWNIDDKQKSITNMIINNRNINIVCIYFTVRHVIPSTWLNDRDQFLFPNDGWETDIEFQNDCLIYTLFHGNNNVTCKLGINHWIPFTEYEVDAHEKFDSSFMAKFLAKRKISPIAKAAFDAGRELWRYYHQQPDCDVNASFYDIREYFQGRSETGRMNNRSADEMYNKLLNELRLQMKLLTAKIEPKVYEYGFLRN